MSTEIALKRIATAKAGNHVYLDLSGLGLTEVPSELFECTALRILYLDNNYISELPEAIENLVNLESLYLRDNKLSSLPKSIKKLTKLEKVDSLYNTKGLYWRKSKSN